MSNGFVEAAVLTNPFFFYVWHMDLLALFSHHKYASKK